VSQARSEVQVDADAREVFTFLEGGAGLPFKVRRVGGTANTVEFSTGFSAFSWGERVEVTVVAQASGCTVLFRGSRVFALNITSNPQTPVERILTALSDRFGGLRTP
jgi:hypothetical protein